MRLYLIVFAALSLSVTSAGAVEEFIPKGHTYAPGQERLPTLNSWQDRVNGQADIYETEIYRIQRERAIHEAEIRRMELHEMQGGNAFQPRF